MQWKIKRQQERNMQHHTQNPEYISQAKEAKHINIYTVLFTLREIQIQANKFFGAYQNAAVTWESRGK